MGGVVVERLLILLVGGGRHDWRTIDAKTKTNGEICSHWERKMKLERIRRKRWKFFFFLYRIADGELRLSISQLGTFLILRMRDVAAAKSHQFPPSFFQPTLIFAPEFSRPATPSILNRLFFVSHFSWKIIRTEKKTKQTRLRAAEEREAKASAYSQAVFVNIYRSTVVKSVSVTCLASSFSRYVCQSKYVKEVWGRRGSFPILSRTWKNRNDDK